MGVQRYVIVTGIPASGKTTVAHAVATALGLALLDKDEILESLFTSQGIGDGQWRTQFSRAADDALQEKARSSGGAVIASWWRHPASRADTGTPVEWLSSLPGVLLELHCLCSPEVAAERFLSRKRHGGHLDHLKTHAELLASFRKQAALGPLNLGRVISVNTEQSLDLPTLLTEIEFPAITTATKENLMP